MAGIGFRLQEMAKRKTFAEWLKLYTYSTIIFSGPWIISILALAALSVFVLPVMQEAEVRLFVVIVVYVFCFSLITTGLIQLVVTRFVSDQFYAHNPDAIVPTYVGTVALVVLFQTATGALALFFAELDFFFKVLALGLYVTVSMVWIAMLFLSAAKDYEQVVISYFLGYLVSFGAGQILGIYAGSHGLLVGFLIGQVALVALLTYRIFSEYTFGRGYDFSFLRYVRRYPALVAAGFMYNAAIWIDKVLFWYSPSGLQIHGYFRTHFPYDSAMFIAYVTILPTIAIFFLRIETDFYMRYKNYYAAVLRKGSLDLIVKRRGEMLDVLRAATRVCLIYQGAVTAAVIILMPFIVALLGIDPELTPVFRVASLGAFFHGGLVIIMILLLYFDFRGSAMFVAATFLLSNAALTTLTTFEPDIWMGWGYLGACLFSLATGVMVFANRFRNLEYLTFMRQPV